MATQSRNGEFSDPIRDKIGKPGVSYPTPNVEDYVVVETLSLEKDQYQKLPYGKAHPDYPAAKLISQRRTAGDDGKINVTRVWATARQNQDAYNAAISYQAKSGAHRILVRSSLVARAGYAALPAYTPDSQNPVAVLVDEQAQPAEEPYNSLYLRVTYTFEDFGTRAEQDAWNLVDGTGFPFLSDLYPRLVRRYRFPANAVPTLTLGSTTDTVTPAAVLTAKAPTNESARVVVILATFEAFPTPAQQAALGGGLGISIAYPEDPAFPVLTIKSVLLNGDYAVSPVGTACPVPGYTSLTITDENRAPADDAPSKTIHTREFQILPGAIVTSTDSSRLPRALTAIPGQYLNGDSLVTIRQKRPYGDAPDPLTGGVLSSKVDAQNRFYAVKTNVSRSTPTYPVLYQPRTVDGAGGAQGNERGQIVEVSDPATLAAAIDAALAALLATTSAFHVLNYVVNELSPTQAEIRALVVTNFPALVGAESSTSIPGKFLEGFALENDEDWIDTTTIQATGQLVTGASVVSCKIVPENAARAKRTTTRLPAGATLPSLTSTRVNAEGQTETVVESVTDGTEAIPAPTATTRTERQALGGGSFLRTVISVPGFALKQGQKLETSYGLVVPFTEQTKSAATAITMLGTPNTEIIPQDELKSLVRTTPPPAALNTFYRSSPCRTRLDLPLVLVGLQLTVANGSATGTSQESGSASAVSNGDNGGSVSASVNITNSCEAGASVIPQLTPVFASEPMPEQDAIDYFFFAPVNQTLSQLIALLYTLTGVTAAAWPKFAPRSHNFTLQGGKYSVRTGIQARRTISRAANAEADSSSNGYSHSQDISHTVTTVSVRESIHEAIDVTQQDGFNAADLYATASINALVQFNDDPNAQAPSGGIGALIFPADVDATPGYTAIPTTGKYVQQVDVSVASPFAGYNPVRLRVFDFATLPGVVRRVGTALVGQPPPPALPPPPAP